MLYSCLKSNTVKSAVSPTSILVPIPNIFLKALNVFSIILMTGGKIAFVEGVERLMGAPVESPDLRAGAALVVAALAAEGETEIGQVQYIERGYEDIVGKLRALGADIRIIDVPDMENEEQSIG